MIRRLEPQRMFSVWLRHVAMLFRTGATATPETDALVVELAARIESQNKNGLPLLAAIDEGLITNKDRLSKFYRLNEETLAHNGLRKELEDVLVDDAREKAARLAYLRTQNKSDTPKYLLMQLFPPFHIRQTLFNYKPLPEVVSNDLPSLGLSYHKLFEQYSSLPSPFHMTPEHYNLTVDKLLSEMNFKRPIVGLGGFANKPSIIVRSHKHQLRERKAILWRLNRLFGDMKRYNIPMTSREKATLAAYTLFKDKSDIHRMVVGAYRILQRSCPDGPNFDFDIYKKFDPDISTTSSLNVFLDLAIRHKSHKVIDFMCSNRKHLFDRQSIIMILDYLASRSAKFRNPEAFQHQLRELLHETPYPLDTGLVNAVMKGFCRIGDIEAAEYILNTVFTTTPPTADNPVYRGLTSKSKETYSTTQKFYDELRSALSKLHLDIKLPCIVPNIDTLTPFLEVYSQRGQYDQVVKIMQMTKSAGLPLTTKAFRIVCGQMARQPDLWRIEDVVDITSVLLGEFEASYTFDHDITINSLPETEIPNSLKPFIEQNIQSKQTLEGGNYTKLTDDLVAQIVKAIQKTATVSKHSDKTQELIDDITRAYQELKDDLKELRKSSPDKNLFTINEATYLKNAFLMDLMERVYTCI